MATGEGRQRSLESHVSRIAIGENLALKPIIAELEQHLARKETGLKGPDPVLQVLYETGNLQRQLSV
jgi:hypothetical protein